MSDANRPNVVYVLADQQRWDTVGAYGHMPMDLTPNLDAMAKEGTLFECAITPQPVCGPARACIQTGQWATSIDFVTNGQGPIPSEGTIADAFTGAGYRTGYVGKWHLGKRGPYDGDESGNRRKAVPLEERGGYEDYWRVADSLEHQSHPYEGVVWDEDDERVEFDGYRVDKMNDMAIEFLNEQANHEEPFFLFLSHLEPHHQNDMDTYVAPEGYAYRYRNPYIPPDLRDHQGDWYEELPDYYGICRRLDETVGRLRETLEVLGMWENTIVVYTSDHGSHFYTRKREYKRSAHDSSIRVPAVVTGPGFEDRGEISAPVNLIDLTVTLLDVVGIEPPDSMDGDSMVPLFNQGPNAWKDEAFFQTAAAQVGRGIRTRRWKFYVSDPEMPDDQPGSDRYIERFLYDLVADPWEQHNLIEESELSYSGEYEDILDDLRGRLLDRMAEAGEDRPEIESGQFWL